MQFLKHTVYQEMWFILAVQVNIQNVPTQLKYTTYVLDHYPVHLFLVAQST